MILIVKINQDIDKIIKPGYRGNYTGYCLVLTVKMLKKTTY